MSNPISRQPLPDHAKKVFSGVIFDVYQWEQPQYDGSIKTFEKLVRPDTVLVLPITTDGQCLFIEEEQPGKVVALSLIGGRIDEGEDPLAAAKREMHEETGYEADDWELIDAVQPVSKIEWSIFTYIARGCRNVAEQHLDSGEKITLKSVSFDEAIAIMSGEKFSDKDISLARMALEASLNAEKKAALQTLLFGS